MKNQLGSKRRLLIPEKESWQFLIVITIFMEKPEEFLGKKKKKQNATLM